MIVRDGPDRHTRFQLDKLTIDGFNAFDNFKEEIRELQISSAAMADLILTEESETNSSPWLVDVYYRSAEVFRGFQRTQSSAVILTVKDKYGGIYSKVYHTKQGDAGFDDVSILMDSTMNVWLLLAEKL